MTDAEIYQANLSNLEELKEKLEDLNFECVLREHSEICGGLLCVIDDYSIVASIVLHKYMRGKNWVLFEVMLVDEYGQPQESEVMTESQTIDAIVATR